MAENFVQTDWEASYKLVAEQNMEFRAENEELKRQLKEKQFLIDANRSANRVYVELYKIAKDALIRLEGRGARKTIRELEKIERERG